MVSVSYASCTTVHPHHQLLALLQQQLYNCQNDGWSRHSFYTYSSSLYLHAYNERATLHFVHPSNMNTWSHSSHLFTPSMGSISPSTRTQYSHNTRCSSLDNYISHLCHIPVPSVLDWRWLHTFLFGMLLAIYHIYHRDATRQYWQFPWSQTISNSRSCSGRNFICRNIPPRIDIVLQLHGHHNVDTVVIYIISYYTFLTCCIYIL